MRVAVYVRVSTPLQVKLQTIEQQLGMVRRYVEEKGWELLAENVFRDDGYSGATLKRPALDALRDRVRLRELEVVVTVSPDRLARNYVHQIVLIEELEKGGCRLEFVERPMSTDPNDQLLLQIRGAVAKYERTLIAEMMRRGRLAKLRAGQLLPWMTVPFGYRTDPERPRDPAGLRVDEYEAAIVRQMFGWYLEHGATLGTITRRLVEAGIRTPTGYSNWSRGTIRGLLKNPAYVGVAHGNTTHQVPAKSRESPLLPVGPGITNGRRPEEEWIPITVPAIVSREVFEMVAGKLSHNRKSSARNNKAHCYLLKTLVSCGACRQGSHARTTWDGRSYYVCRGRSSALVPEQRCRARFVPAA